METLTGVLTNEPDTAERICFHDAEMAEVALFLPGAQAVVLERLAHQRGLTVARLIRLLIRDYLMSERLLPGAVERKE